MKKMQPLIAFLLVLLIGAAAVLWQNVYRERVMKTAYPVRYRAYVEKYAAAARLDPNLVYAVIKNESSFRPDAQSNIGARGLMQLTPETFEWAQMLSPPKEKLPDSAITDPETNIRYGTVVLSTLLTEFGSTRTALAAYHAGRGNVKKWLGDSRYSADGKTLAHIPFADTNTYVGRVLKTETVYHNLYGSVKTGR